MSEYIINPFTNRKIKRGGPTHRRVMLKVQAQEDIKNELQSIACCDVPEPKPECEPAQPCEIEPEPEPEEKQYVEPRRCVKNTKHKATKKKKPPKKFKK